jgi:hypothetical protein
VKTAGPGPLRADPDDFQLIDVEQLKDWTRFVLHALGRRKLLAFTVALLTLAATAGLLATMPRTYRIEAQLLAQRNTLMPALGNPSRTIPLEADSPTRAAAETVLRRDNLVSLIKQTDLFNRWNQTRPWLFRLKDRVTNLMGAPTEEERLNAMIGLLEQRLVVTKAESTVTIAIDWPEAELGYRLVDTAVQNFLEQRHTLEISTIAETISILEGHATNLREAIDAALDDLKRSHESSSARAREEAPPVPRRDPAQEAIKAEAAQVKVMLEAKRRAVNDLDEFRRRRLAELQAELAQQRAVYADAHPAVAKLLQSIEALQEDSPQLNALRKDEHDLVLEYDKLASRRPEGIVPPSGSARSAEGSLRRRAGELSTEEVSNDYGRTRLRFAMEKYDGLMERIESARIELDTARAAFKYRYSIVRPPTLPKRPVKPQVPLVVVAGVMAAMALATIAAALADLRSGRVLELWQVQRGLGLPILGQVPRL